MTAIKTITLIGSGNVATHLGKTFFNEGFKINDVFSQSLKNAQKLATQLGALATNCIESINTNSDIYIISLKDDVIKDKINNLKVHQKIVVHTSGSVPMSVLSSFKHHGIFYPLQTFSKEKPMKIENVPFCIEANDKNTKTALLELAKSISNNVHEIDSEQRKKIHLAAVFACNFSNHMYSIAADLLRQHDIDFSILKPLIAETAAKIKENSPQSMQTGPAIRRDEEVIKNHIEMLAGFDEYKDIYKIITEHIIKQQ